IKQAEIKVYTITGKQATFTARSSFKNNNVNVKAELAPGVYVVKASTAKGLYTKKFLVSE
ncbi:MAG: T9SS type A sorting domain-containing protein, partial [Reichenbachiella sp.]